MGYRKKLDLEDSLVRRGSLIHDQGRSFLEDTLKAVKKFPFWAKRIRECRFLGLY